jgi:hypothetical protein
MRPAEEVARVRELSLDGYNACEIARLTGIPRSTLREWLNPRYRPRCPPGPTCSACGHPVHVFDDLPAPEYSYLLGIYLGDGTISRLPKKRCFKLRVFMDSRYPNIIAEVVAAMRAVMPTSIASVQCHPRHNAVEIHSYSNAWPCLFPQYGPGRKHERKIKLAPWQQAIVDREPEQFIRGLIHSDGCRTTNRVTVAGKRYAYSRYFFSQVSKDIQELFCRSCRRLGIEYTFSGGRGREISVARAPSVARLDSFVGPKS